MIVVIVFRDHELRRGCNRPSITWPKFLDDIRRLYRESEFPIPIYGSYK